MICYILGSWHEDFESSPGRAKMPQERTREKVCRTKAYPTARNLNGHDAIEMAVDYWRNPQMLTTPEMAAADALPLGSVRR